MKFCRTSLQLVSFFLILVTEKAFGNDQHHNGGEYTVMRTSQHQSLTSENNANVMTIAVLGRSGSGVSSTVRELVGLHTECTKPEGSENFPDILEYTIEVPLSSGNFHQFKILDVPGFVDGRSLEQESQILAALKYYVQTVSSPPDFYLGLTKMDDSRIDGIHSLFVQFLKRVELFHGVFLNNTITNADRKIVFLLTHLMSTTRVQQRKPEEKIEQFRRVIQEFTLFPSPISIVVGDNKAESEYGVKVENGYYRLPNKQLYPKNIWEALINVSSNSTTQDVLTAIMNSRQAQLKCEAKLISPSRYKRFDDDADSFYYLLSLKNTTIEKTEVNTLVQTAFEENGETQVENIIQRIALQLRLQQENITNKEDLPKTLTERAAFFQKNKQFSATISAHALNKAFNLTMPEYTQPLTVGYGYVVMSDEIATQTPFRTDAIQPSPIGYQIPNFIQCRKLIRPAIQFFKSYSANMPDYIRERLKYLNFRGKEHADVNSFEVKVMEGFNFQPEEGENVVTLTAVEEHRTLTCKLASDPSLLTLTTAFTDEVNALMKFDKHDRDSVNEWKNWFNKWGSHIIVYSYGGGRLHGSIVGTNVRKVLESKSSIDETLNSIINFEPFTVDNLGTPSYRLYGGQGDPMSERLYTLDANAKKELINKWEESLNADFIMLTNEFTLQPISEIITEKLGDDKGRIVEEAIDHLLKGELKYSRKRKPTGAGGMSNQRISTGTDREQQPPPKSQTPRYPSNSDLPPHSTGSGTLDPTQGVLQTQLDNNNQLILEMERKLNDKRNQDREQHQRDLDELNRLKEERESLNQRRKAEMEETRRQSDWRQTANQNQLETINQQGQSQLDLYQRNLDEMRKYNEEKEREHKLLMDQLKNRKKVELNCKSTGYFWSKYKCTYHQ